MLKSFFNILSDVVSVESKTTTTYKGENNMGRKTLSRTQKFLNALQRGESISWKQVLLNMDQSPRTSLIT